MIWIKLISLAVTIGVALFTFNANKFPGAKGRSLQMLATTFTMMGVPTAILLVWCAAQGKWAGFFLICSMISSWAVGCVLGYVYAEAFVTNRFNAMFIMGLLTMIATAAPLGIAFLP